jgi:hypothetical protein
MSHTTCRQAVAEYFSALRAMDVDRWVDTFAPDAESHDPSAHLRSSDTTPFVSSSTGSSLSSKPSDSPKITSS